MEIGGLPLELWRLILAYLPLRDLGRCGLVCRSWHDLIISLDNTRWRQICLGCSECRHPNWPIKPEVEPRSWREAFKQHYVASRTWTKNAQDLESSNCLYLFRRKKDRRVLYVGYGCEFENLRTAVASANIYDRIMLQPGVYEEQNEIILKVPVEIMGQGKLGDVALLVCIDQQCPTSRLCNLVFMPAWFTPIMYKTSIGYVQFDNCNFENGQLQIHAPGTCQIKFCTFNQSSIHFHNVALSVLEKCEFVNSENASVTVEGSPTSDKNWACKHLSASAKSRAMLYMASESSLPGNTDYSAVGSPGAKMRTCEILVNGDQSHSHPQSKSQILEDHTNDKENELNGNFYMGKDGEAMTLDTDYSDSELSTISENEDDDQSLYKLSYHSHGLSHMLAKSLHCRPQTNGLLALQNDMALKSLHQELQKDKELQTIANSVQGCLVWKCLFRDGKGGIFICSQGQARLEGCIFRDLTYAVRCIQNSKIVMLRNDVYHCKASGVFLRLAAGGLIADNNIHSNTEAGVDIRKGANPVILCNRIHSGLRSGIVVLGNGKGSIRSNQIYGNKEAGIYILYNGNPVVSGNHIFQGLAAGIAVNENGRGQITGNKGCGVWIMSSSLPHITSNQIGHNSIYGVAVFCRKDDACDYPANQAGHENFNDEGEAASWENDLDSEDDRFSSRRPINVALVESNSINHNGAAGLYIKSSEALNIIANAVHANHDSGVAVFQSTQLVRIGNNSISCNRLSGVHVETGCRVELRGNGIYDNRSHGIISKGDGTITENDIIGNRGCGLQLIQTADMKVTRNRIQSLHDYGIALLDQTKSLVQENLIFQGKSGQNILQQVSNNEDCIVQHNKLLTYKKKPDVTWKLENPPARPYIEGCTRGVSSTQSSQRVATVTTRLAARVEGRCHNNGSIFCTIL
ncbi:F-box only protein 10 isoform X2 [Phyllobates terribilis]|uniref:F-box only protein 10 isoform X2 n=1 Tax=Phyllobates terribilis TaxID=111132 RepID=UPI003CCAF372